MWHGQDLVLWLGWEGEIGRCRDLRLQTSPCLGPLIPPQPSTTTIHTHHPPQQALALADLYFNTALERLEASEKAFNAAAAAQAEAAANGQVAAMPSKSAASDAIVQAKERRHNGLLASLKVRAAVRGP